MKNEIIKYKGLNFRQNKDYDYLELIVDDTNFLNSESYIEAISIMVEYAVRIHPGYLVINKLDSDFKLPKELFGFTKKTIYQPLKINGIKRVMMLVPEEPFRQQYANIEQIDPYMIAFKSIKDIENWISNNQKP